MKEKDEITVRMKSRGGCRIEKLPLVQMKDALDSGGRVTILVRHAERPPLDPGDKTFGASLSLTENGWRWAQNFGLMLANNLLPKAVVDSFSDETWPNYLDAAVVIKRGKDEAKYLYFRWDQDMDAISM